MHLHLTINGISQNSNGTSVSSDFTTLESETTSIKQAKVIFMLLQIIKTIGGYSQADIARVIQQVRDDALAGNKKIDTKVKKTLSMTFALPLIDLPWSMAWVAIGSQRRKSSMCWRPSSTTTWSSLAFAACNSSRISGFFVICNQTTSAQVWRTHRSISILLRCTLHERKSTPLSSVQQSYNRRIFEHFCSMSTFSEQFFCSEIENGRHSQSCLRSSQ